MSEARPIVWLARHGETEWSRTLRHTGRTDIPLTPEGEEEARALREPFAAIELDRVFCSPLGRARQTCELAGLGERAEIRDSLLEWDYGEYEGITSKEIHETRPEWLLWRDGCPGGESPASVGARADEMVEALLEWDYGDYEGITIAQIHETRPAWLLWRDGCPNGESPQEVGARADEMVAELLGVEGTVAVFAHGHLLRVLAARWLGLDAGEGRLFGLGTATLSRLGWEHDYRVIQRWNAPVR